MKHPIIDIDHITQQFGSFTALNDVSLKVHSGEILGFLGPSGSGKTTLVKVIIGMNHPQKGTVTIGKVQIPHLGILRHIGYMAQEDALYNDLSGMDNLMFFAQIFGMRKREAKKRAVEVMDLVELTEHANKAVKHYSGGMRRRLSLCIALIHEPKILILDEPTVGIDPVLRKRFWKEFERLQQEGRTILITTHVMDEAEKCDRLVMIRNGEVTAIGTPDELKTQSSSSSLEDAFLYYGQGHEGGLK